MDLSRAEVRVHHRSTMALDRQPWAMLTAALERAGADVPRSIEQLRKYAEMLLDWNRGRSNLISRADESRLVARHLAESLDPAGWMRDSGVGEVLDFGSGGGLPAVPLAIVGVGRRWTLVESRRNKTLFLRKVIEDLGLEGVKVELGRLEAIAEQEDLAGRFEGFTSRATLRLGPTLALAARLVSPGGHAFLWKGSRLDEEMAEDDSWRNSWSEEERVQLSGGQAVVVRFARRA